MRNLKTSLLFVLFISLASGLSAQLTFGAGASYNLEFEQLGVLGRVEYQITEEIFASGGFTYYLSDGAEYAIDLNGYYTLATIGENIKISPMAGINITSFPSVVVPGFGSFGSGSSTTIQVGALFDIPLSSFDLGIEPKLVLNGSQFVISGYVMFGGGE